MRLLFSAEPFMDSLQWMMVKFGPTLTSRFVIRPALHTASLCFLNEAGAVLLTFDRNGNFWLVAAKIRTFSVLMLSRFVSVLGWNAFIMFSGETCDKHMRVADCLILAVSIYGPSMITLQYIPHFYHVVRWNFKLFVDQITTEVSPSEKYHLAAITSLYVLG